MQVVVYLEEAGVLVAVEVVEVEVLLLQAADLCNELVLLPVLKPNFRIELLMKD
jgi:hypothetical protein